MSKSVFRILQPADFTPDVIRQVIDLGMRSGTWQDSDVKYYKEQFANPCNINITCQSEDGLITGYILAKPHNEAVQDYLVEDPAMAVSDVGMFYVDIVITDMKQNRASVSLRLINEMVKEGNRRGISRFSMHARVSNGFSAIIQRKFDIDSSRRIKRYVDCNNEPFDYLEGNCFI